MFASELLPDLAAALLPTIEFTDRLDVSMGVGTDKPTISVTADGRQIALPVLTAGEVPGLPVA